MATRPQPLGMEPEGSADPLHGPQGAGGQRMITQRIEGLMGMVKKLQKVGNLEPRIEVLINRINEVQQAKKKASEELGEAQTVWDTLQKDLDSLHEEKVRLKDILNKKQETLRIIRLQCQEKESEAQRKHGMLQECKERISFLNSQIDKEKEKLRQLRLNFEEQLETLMSQHKDLLEFHKPEHLAEETCTLDSSKEQLLKEEKLIEVKLEDVKHRLSALCGPERSSTLTEGLFLRSHEAAAAMQLFKDENKKAEELLEAAAQHHQQLQQRCQQLQQKRQRLKEELEKHGVQILAQVQSMQDEADNSWRMASPKPLGVHEEKEQECPPSRT
ncbi:synaptonemal complex central element protein 1 [Phodopus roborovskii]|uniref:Synaptonemal complex central element protein 1 n=1 Tax=Phodopus roborovskii TaxID=109678 RepID=A0AAU9ZKU4_PHORO|nr:synaptonemal complex central element protein 1 [Phodopus roborovskii]CAH6793309.1 Syce1 [Phodopus roborovskii]